MPSLDPRTPVAITPGGPQWNVAAALLPAKQARGEAAAALRSAAAWGPLARRRVPSIREVFRQSQRPGTTSIAPDMTTATPTTLLLPLLLLMAAPSPLSFAAQGIQVLAPLEAKQHAPTLIHSDGTVRLNFGPERVILPRGLQPSLLCTRSGTLIVQPRFPASRLRRSGSRTSRRCVPRCRATEA